MNEAHLIVSAILDGDGQSAKEWLRGQGKKHVVKRDPAHEKYFQIPVPSGNHATAARYVSLWKPKTASPEKELQDRLRWLLKTRKGYRPGDLFMTPFGNFRVTDSLDVDRA
jgi:hypothetical protein